MTFTPVALACGHVATEAAWYDVPAEGSPDVHRIACPEGCGWQEFVVEPDVDDLLRRDWRGEA